MRLIFKWGRKSSQERNGNVTLHPNTAIQTLGVEIACESDYSSQVATAVSLYSYRVVFKGLDASSTRLVSLKRLGRPFRSPRF